MKGTWHPRIFPTELAGCILYEENTVTNTAPVQPHHCCLGWVKQSCVYGLVTLDSKYISPTRRWLGNIHGFFLDGKSHQKGWSTARTPNKPTVSSFKHVQPHYYRVRRMEPNHRLVEVARRSSWATEFLALCPNNINNKVGLVLSHHAVGNEIRIIWSHNQSMFHVYILKGKVERCAHFAFLKILRQKSWAGSLVVRAHTSEKRPNVDRLVNGD